MKRRELVSSAFAVAGLLAFPEIISAKNKKREMRWGLGYRGFDNSITIGITNADESKELYATFRKSNPTPGLDPKTHTTKKSRGLKLRQELDLRWKENIRWRKRVLGLDYRPDNYDVTPDDHGIVFTDLTIENANALLKDKQSRMEFVSALRDLADQCENTR